MKQFGIFCLIFVVLAAALPVMADSVWMPMDDYFMNTWEPSSDSTCEYVHRRTFMAAGEEGFAVAVKTPLDQTPIATYPNGTEFIVDFFCGIGDEKWGTIRSTRYPGENTFTEDYTGQSGYIAKRDLIQAYDTDSFSPLRFSSFSNPVRRRLPSSSGAILIRGSSFPSSVTVSWTGSAMTMKCIRIIIRSRRIGSITRRAEPAGFPFTRINRIPTVGSIWTIRLKGLSFRSIDAACHLSKSENLDFSAHSGTIRKVWRDGGIGRRIRLKI